MQANIAPPRKYLERQGFYREVGTPSSPSVEVLHIAACTDCHAPVITYSTTIHNKETAASIRRQLTLWDYKRPSVAHFILESPTVLCDDCYNNWLHNLEEYK